MATQWGFVSDLVRNPEDRFFHDTAQLMLATFFCHCGSVFNFCLKQPESSTAKAKKRKQKVEDEDISTGQSEEEVPKKRKRKDKADINTATETVPEGSKPHKKKKIDERIQKKKNLRSEQTDVPQVSHSPGFNPPAGIVHESLMDSGKKKNKKR